MITVSWSYTEKATAPCPEPNTVDPYTGKVKNAHFDCKVSHFVTRSISCLRQFDTLEEAQAFIENSPPTVKPTMLVLEENVVCPNSWTTDVRVTTRDEEIPQVPKMEKATESETEAPTEPPEDGK